MYPVNKEISDDESCVAESEHSSLIFNLVQAFSIVSETMAREMVPLRRQTIFSAEMELT